MSTGQRRIVALFALAAMFSLALVAVAYVAHRLRRTDYPVLRPEDRPFSTMPSEETVESYVRTHELQPRAVRFERWGPHDLTGELINHRRGHDDRILRARYRTRSAQGEEIVVDQLFYFLNDEVSQVIVNTWGDDWQAAIRQLNDPRK